MSMMASALASSSSQPMLSRSMAALFEIAKDSLINRSAETFAYSATPAMSATRPRISDPMTDA